MRAVPVVNYVLNGFIKRDIHRLNGWQASFNDEDCRTRKITSSEIKELDFASAKSGGSLKLTPAWTSRKKMTLGVSFFIPWTICTPIAQPSFWHACLPLNQKHAIWCIAVFLSYRDCVCLVGVDAVIQDATVSPLVLCYCTSKPGKGKRRRQFPWKRWFFSWRVSSQSIVLYHTLVDAARS